jgi:hypothetical protein
MILKRRRYSGWVRSLKQSACILFGRAVASSIPAVHTEKSLDFKTFFVLLIARDAF